MQEHKENLMEVAGLIVLFILLAAISYGHIEPGMSIIQYLWVFGIKSLLANYGLYHHAFKDFLFQTSSFHPGNSGAGWRTVIFLFPLFLFSDLLGGLSLKTIWLFSITASLIFLVLFYWWIRSIWGKSVAFFSTVFLGFSAIFQEISRSGGYHAYSFLIVMGWLIYCFRPLGSQRASYWGILGLWTGSLWYAYGVVRGLTVVAFVRAWRAKTISKKLAVGFLLAGMMVVTVPGAVVLLEQHANDQKHLHFLFIDKENIIDDSNGKAADIIMRLSINARIFLNRMLGGQQVFEFPMSWKSNAPFVNPWLVIPMFLGMAHTFRLRKQKSSNQLLLLASFMIYLVPVLTSHGYNEPRRSLFYVIPDYCFIGIGTKVIMDRIGSFHKITQWLMKLLLISIFVAVFSSENNFVRREIISSTRDIGMLSFAKKIKQMGAQGNLFYLEGRSIYMGAKESDVLRLILMEKGRAPDIKAGGVKDKVSEADNSFFVARGPDVSDEGFNSWTVLNKLKCTLILKSALTNLLPGKKQIWVDGEDRWDSSVRVQPFRVYAVNRYP